MGSIQPETFTSPQEDPVTKQVNDTIPQPCRNKVDSAKWGVAAPCTSDDFRMRSHKHKPPALLWDHLLSSESTSRKGSSLKSAFKYLQDPNIISLGGGLPLSDYFPFEAMRLNVLSPKSFEEQVISTHTSDLYSTKSDIALGNSIYDLAVALNYSQGSGSAQLLRWITEHVEMVHDPPYANWQCTMSIGNTSALDMVLRMFVKPGDYVLSDDYTFATAVETLEPMGASFVGIEMDSEGMLPHSLHHTLKHWDPAKKRGSKKPFLLYTIPTGQNPTGTTQSLQRRKDIYRVAQEYDLIILEDDPYYFLQMDPFQSNGDEYFDNAQSKPSDALLKMILPSYLSLDTDGRVIRMDSFSKVVSPGLRLGWITASPQIVERYKGHADVSTQGPSGFSQLALFKLLDEHWGHSGYMRWLLHLRHEYTKRRSFTIYACKRYLPERIVSWEVAQAGMFQWLKVDWHKHPEAGKKTMLEIEEEIWLESIGHGALIARGSWFYATASELYTNIFFRITFAAAPMDRIEKAVERLGNALRKSFKIEL